MEKPKYIGLKISITGVLLSALLTIITLKMESVLFIISIEAFITFVVLLCIFAVKAKNYKKRIAIPTDLQVEKSAVNDLSEKVAVTIDESRLPHVVLLDCTVTPHTVKEEIAVPQNVRQSNNPLTWINYLYNTYHFSNLNLNKQLINCFIDSEQDQTTIRRCAAFCTLHSAALQSAALKESNNALIEGAIMDVVLEDGRIASIFICRENNNGVTVNIFGKEISNIKGLTRIVPGLTVSARNYLEKAESYISFLETVNEVPLPTGRQSLGYFVSPKGVYCKTFQLDNAEDPFALDFMQLVFHHVSGYFDVKGLNAGEEFIASH